LRKSAVNVWDWVDPLNTVAHSGASVTLGRRGHGAHVIGLKGADFIGLTLSLPIPLTIAVLSLVVFRNWPASTASLIVTEFVFGSLRLLLRALAASLITNSIG